MYEFIRSAVAIQVIAAAGAAAALMAVLMFQRGRRAAGKDALSGGTLRRPESRIRATARLGQDKPAGAADQLEPYWYSKDPDERYFSLYFSSACADGPLQKERLRRAVLAAPFCGGRRAEMLRTLGLSNAVLQQKAEESGRGGADMIGSLNGTALTAPELERLLLLLDRSPLCGARPWAALPTAACPAPSTACRTSPCTTRTPRCGNWRRRGWKAGRATRSSACWTP